MNIAYSCNDAYISQTGISIISLLENNKNLDKIDIYIIAKDMSIISIDLLKEIVCGYRRRLIILPFDQVCSKLNIQKTGRHIETVYAKLFFGNIPEIDKIFYLDSDTIITGSLQSLWDISLEDHHFGCVKTITKDACRKLCLSEKQDFYNDGVAMVNVRALRRHKMEDKFLKFIASYDGNPPFLSEGVINVVCKGKIKALVPKYNFLSGFLMFSNKEIRRLARQPNNFYSDDELDEARKKPIVIHYLAGWFKRPWESGCTHPLKDYYYKYKQMSPWKEQPLIYKKQPFKIKILKIAFKSFPIDAILFLRKVLRYVQQLGA